MAGGLDCDPFAPEVMQVHPGDKPRFLGTLWGVAV
jgi:hypothetical protein